MIHWHPTWAEIDVKQFRKNIQIVKSFIGKSLYCLPIKANAYGHGLAEIGKIAVEEGVDYLAVAHASEGVFLRKEGIYVPILVMGAIHKEQVEDLLDYDLEVSVSSRLKAELIRDKCKKLQKQCKVHLEIDTGMHRTGMQPESAILLYKELSSDSFLDVVGIYSHFASTDEHGNKQMETFKNICEEIASITKKPLIKHIGNSAGITSFSECFLDMVRPGLLTFGYEELNQEREVQNNSVNLLSLNTVVSRLNGIAPCFSLKSKVSYFKVVEKNKGISYNQTFYTQKKSRIVTISIGYGDGYRRDLSNKGQVLIRGKKYPIIGSICMDQCMVNVGEDDVFVGDEVVLIGKQGVEEITLQHIAKLCNTIPYEIVCGLNQRVPRIYI
jgi:alanine racemase